ncbi:DMT family transporter [Rhodobaculum claviforme]|uniref:DMT family transporter n=1 Tax=Rhodobaculum claviforme TaxID=1549854 RepID=UPI003084507E
MTGAGRGAVAGTPDRADIGRPLAAFGWMLGAIASFVLMAVSGREVQAELNSFQLMAWRSAIGFAIVCAAMALSRPGFAQARTAQPWLHVKRNVFHFAGQNAWFMALMLLPLAQLVALEFTSPIWVALLAALMLGERLTRRKIVAVLLGFTGVLIVAQPGVEPIQIGHAVALMAALGFALNTIYTKQIMAHDTVLCVLFWMTLSQGLMGLVLGLPGGFPWPSAGVWPWLVLVGMTGLSAHYCLTSALGHAPASIVAPMEFLRLPVIATVGALVYAESVAVAVFVGGAVILTANMVNIGVRWPRRRRAG